MRYIWIFNHNLVKEEVFACTPVPIGKEPQTTAAVLSHLQTQSVFLKRIISSEAESISFLKCWVSKEWYTKLSHERVLTAKPPSSVQDTNHKNTHDLAARFSWRAMRQDNVLPINLLHTYTALSIHHTELCWNTTKTFSILLKYLFLQAFIH